MGRLPVYSGWFGPVGMNPDFGPGRETTIIMEPFRFVHAARLLLDHQLHGIAALPDDLRPVVEDATLIAFDRVIDSCLEQGVDCLLIAGDSFDSADHSLRG